MSKFTPGPWEMGKHHPKAGNSPAHYEISQSGEMYYHAIALSATDGGEGKANARLIAVAPEMYAELKRHCLECQANKRLPANLCEICCTRAALKKAGDEA